MKKLIAIAASLAAACTLSVSAFATEATYTEDDVLNLIQTADINGVALDESYYTATLNYFNTVELDTADTTALYNDILATIDFCEAKNITSIATLVVNGTEVDAIDLTTLPMEDKEELLSLANTMCEDIGLTFSYYPVSKKAVVTGETGTIVEITHAVKQTGSAAGVVAVSAALVAAMGACAVVAKKKDLVK